MRRPRPDNYTIRWMSSPDGVDRDDSNVDVEVTFVDGSRYVATFFTVRNITTLLDRHAQSGESAGGAYLWASDMIIVRRLDDEIIALSIADLLNDGLFESAFMRCDPE